ncbi:MAG TPA: YoaK family protein [Gemmatimonadales bacterium]|nr:YoaK family protein [Gemmatimonadales bacterium]
MSVRPAVARRLFYRQRRWIFPAMVTLAALAGFVDVAVIALAGLPVSHMSGSVARVASDAAAHDLVDLWRVARVILAFLLGAMVSGLVIGLSRVLPGRRYGAVLLLEAAALAGAVWLLGNQRPALGAALAAFACGLQNGMVNGFYGVILRTTHLSGILTDLGVMLGHRLRGGTIAWWRIGLLASIVGGFVAGGVGGAVAVHRLGAESLLIPALACFGLGGAFTGWLWWQHPARRGQRDPVPATFLS